MPSKKNITPIIPEKVYHIYNRGHNYDNTFFQKSDYTLFIKYFKVYLKNDCYLYAYALIPNHYHFLLRIKKSSPFGNFSNQYRKFILAYTNFINYRDKRSGSLFLRPFKRIEVTNEDYFKRLLFYIHFNSQKHGISKDFKTYSHCSFPSYIKAGTLSLNRDVVPATKEVFKIFGSVEDFIQYHNYVADEYRIRKMILEE